MFWASVLFLIDGDLLPAQKCAGIFCVWRCFRAG